MVKQALTGETISVTEERHSTTADGLNYFGLLEVSNKRASTKTLPMW
jgi:hypothetical protein